MVIAAKFCQTLALSARIPSGYRHINYVEATQLSASQALDAVGYAQTSLASLFEAISGIKSQRYVWAIIKLYYSVFYSMQARLLLRGFSIFYIGKTPYTLRSLPGEAFVKRQGNSHVVAFNLFKDEFPNDVLLSQPIDGVEPLAWMEELRNKASYGSAPSMDPAIPIEFIKINSNIRLHLQAYLRDTLFLYAFDKEHSAVAFPIEMLKSVDRDIIKKSTKVNVTKHFIDILASIGCYIPEFKDLKSFEFQ